MRVIGAFWPNADDDWATDEFLLALLLFGRDRYVEFAICSSDEHSVILNL